MNWNRFSMKGWAYIFSKKVDSDCSCLSIIEWLFTLSAKPVRFPVKYIRRNKLIRFFYMVPSAISMTIIIIIQWTNTDSCSWYEPEWEEYEWTYSLSFVSFLLTFPQNSLYRFLAICTYSTYMLNMLMMSHEESQEIYCINFFHFLLLFQIWLEKVRTYHERTEEKIEVSRVIREKSNQRLAECTLFAG